MSTPQGPRQPLDEAHEEINRLQVRIAQLEAVANAARTYLVSTIPINALKLHDALREARGEKQG